jgi:hypothetical protein
MEKGTGTIFSIKTGGNAGVIKEDGSTANLDFINPSIPGVSIGDRFEFLKIIQSTPNGEKVINVLQVKLP